MIQDLDGGDIGPSRAPFIRAISVALVVAAAIGWAALQQPALRGPYATPDPSGGVVFKERFTPAPFVNINPASAAAPGGFGCVVPGSVSTTQVFVGGQLVTISRPQALSVDPRCDALYLQWQRLPVPIERLAR